MSNKVHKTHGHLHRVLASFAGNGYTVASLTADAPRAIVEWCDRVLRVTEPQQHKGHGLSRLDARDTVDSVRHLRGCAHRFIDAVNGAVKQHDQAIIAHNRRARARIQRRRAAEKTS